MKYSKPLESTTDSETTSAQYSSSEDLETVAVGEVDPGYAMVNIIPRGGPSPISTGSQDSGEASGYANPLDAVNLPSEVIQKRLSMGPTVVAEEKISDFTEAQQSSPYQSVEDVRKMREIQQRQQLKQTHGQRSHSVSPNASHTNLQQEDGGGQVNYYDNNPGYSRPFDALSGVSPFKVSSDNIVKKLHSTPVPPVMRRVGSGDRPGKERSARFLHQTNMTTKDGEKASSEDKAVSRGCTHKRSWKVAEPSYRTNGTLTPPPPVPIERPKPMEHWQLPHQKQQETSDKSYLRSQSYQNTDLGAEAASKAAENDTHLFIKETGRTSSEGAMLRLRAKPPLVSIQQLKAKKLNTTRAS